MVKLVKWGQTGANRSREGHTAPNMVKCGQIGSNRPNVDKRGQMGLNGVKQG